jgi:hypothetical protein
MQQKRDKYHTFDGRDKLTSLRALMDDDVSLERAYSEIHQHHFEGRAAQSTVEALMLGLRERGVAALKEPPVQQRLDALSEPQLHEVCARLQHLDSKSARPWTADEVVRLVELWAACHGR